MVGIVRVFSVQLFPKDWVHSKLKRHFLCPGFTGGCSLWALSPTAYTRLSIPMEKLNKALSPIW
jgi:hypothetical protein